MVLLETLEEEARFHHDKVRVFTSLLQVKHLCPLFRMNLFRRYWSMLITRLLLLAEG